MTTPRHRLVSPTQPMFYHIVSRCVRRSWLCGKHGRRDYSHRKNWLIERMHQLGQAFAIEIYAYAIMSNHFHLVVYYDPVVAQSWSNEEVADRWLQACPPRKKDGVVDTQRLAKTRQTILADITLLAHLRAQLGSQSTFMQLLKQPIARRANLEDGCSGHFFEQRFYSAALLSETAILAAMAYVDLNSIRAKIADTLEASHYTSIAERLRSGELKLPMRPIVSGIVKPKFVMKVILSEYVKRLQSLIGVHSPESKDTRWWRHVTSLRKRQRAYGGESELEQWITERGMQMRESPLL